MYIQVYQQAQEILSHPSLLYFLLVQDDLKWKHPGWCIISEKEQIYQNKALLFAFHLADPLVLEDQANLVARKQGTLCMFHLDHLKEKEQTKLKFWQTKTTVNKWMIE